MSRVLVTGTGRCGSGWCAEVLRRAGIRAGHQDVIRHEHVLGRSAIDWRDYEVEVSFEATPMLERDGWREEQEIDRVVLVVRHPLAVIRSWLSLGAFGDNMSKAYVDFSAVLEAHCPAVLQQATARERAGMFWASWNASAYACADAVLRIEDATPETLLEACYPRGWPRPPEAPPPIDVGDARPRLEVALPTWAELGQRRELVAVVAKFLGYKEAAP